MSNPGFQIPIGAPLLPVHVDLLPGGLVISQGISRVQFDEAGVDGLINVIGLLVLIRLGAAAQNASSSEIIQ